MKTTNISFPFRNNSIIPSPSSPLVMINLSTSNHNHNPLVVLLQGVHGYADFPFAQAWNEFTNWVGKRNDNISMLIGIPRPKSEPRTLNIIIRTWKTYLFILHLAGILTVAARGVEYRMFPHFLGPRFPCVLCPCNQCSIS